MPRTSLPRPAVAPGDNFNSSTIEPVAYPIRVMIALLLAIVGLAAQGIPVLSNQSATVTGVLRTPTGSPAAGVRVSALAKPESVADLTSATSLAGLAETDISGQYRLENIPPGRYYIVAGRIDLPTFYPGTVTADEGVSILVTPGLTVTGIDFVLNNLSVGRALPLLGNPPSPSWVIPLQTRVEGGGKIPIFAEGRFPTLRLKHANGVQVEAALSASSVTIAATVTTADPRATVEYLPPGYALKSFTFGPTDLRTNALQLALPSPAVGGAVIPVPQAISVILERLPAPPLPGVRVSGRIQADANRSIHLSGKPGTLYTDGTFEFFGVLPGRHAIVTLDNPGRERPLGASIIVGDRDLLNVELAETSIAPFAAGLPAGPAPAENLSPNPRVPLASIRGRVVDAMTGAPFDAGRVLVNNDHSLTFSLEAGGRFEVPRLLPGSYFLEVTAFGVGTVSKALVLDDKDVTLELSIGPAP